MQKIRFVVAGSPIGKERARRGRDGHFYTPSKTADYEKLIGQEFYLASGDMFDEICRKLQGQVSPFRRASPFLRIDIKCYFDSEGHSDMDNVDKAVNDAIAHMLCVNDRNFYGMLNKPEIDKDRPRLEVEVWT